MNRNKKILFLLSIFVVLFVATSAVTATDSSNATATSTDSQVAVSDDSQVSTNDVSTSSVTTKEVATTTTSDTHSSDTSSSNSQSSTTSSSDTTVVKSSSSDTQTVKDTTSSSDTTTKSSSSSNSQDTIAGSSVDTAKTTVATESQSSDNSNIKNQNSQIENTSIIDQKTDIKQATITTQTITNANNLPTNLESNTIYILDGITVTDTVININGENTTLTGTNNAKITDTWIYIGGDAKNVTISDIAFTYTSNYQEEDGIYLDSNSIATDELAYTTIENCNFTIEARTVDNSKWFPISSSTSSIIIRNNNLKGDFYSYKVNYYGEGEATDLPSTGLIKIDASSESILPAIITGNNITVDATKYVDSNPELNKPTFFAIIVNGPAVNFTENNLNLTGSQWMYAVRVYASNCNLSSNNIKVNSERYAAGIYLSGRNVHNNTIANNVIDLTVGDKPHDLDPEDVAYCIVVENFAYGGGTLTSTSQVLQYCSNNTVKNNTLSATGNNVYGIELYGANDTKVLDNNIVLTGSTPMGIGMVAANSNVTNNNIKVTGNATTASTVDYITARTAGICTTRGYGNNFTDNTIYTYYNSAIYVDGEKTDNIKQNTLTVEEADYGIELSADDSNVTDNSITLNGKINNNAIYEKGDGNKIEYTELSTTLTLNSISTQTYGNSVDITGTLRDSNNNAVAGETVTITVNGKSIGSATTTSTGSFSIKYTVDTEGTNTVVASYAGSDGAYKSSSNQRTFNVMLTTTITVSTNSTANPDSTITVRGTLKDQKSNNLPANTQITLTFNQKTYTTPLNSTGGYSIDVTTPSNVGSYTMEVSYAGNSTYQSSSATTTVTIGKPDTTITLTTPSTIAYGNSTIISGVLQTTNGYKIANATIKLSINNDTYNVTTDSNGEYRYNYSTTKTNITKTQQVTVVATYDGTNQYGASNANKTFTIDHIASDITVTGIETKNGNNVTLTAYVTDENGNPVNFGQATFKLNGVTMKVNGTQLKTDVVNGVAQINYTIPNYSAKDYNLTAVYGLTDVRLEDSSVLTILKSNPELVLNSVTSNGTTGHITGMLLDEHGVGVDRDTKVSVKLNGKTVESTRIYDGIIDITFDTSAYKNGIHNLTVIFGENGCYNTVTYEGVLAQNIKDAVVIDKVSGKDQETVALNAYFIDKNGNSVTSGSATFKLNGVTIKENGTQVKVDIVNGVATYNFTIPDYSAKDYNLTAVGSVGTTRYENTSVLTVLRTDTHIDLSDMSITKGSNAQLVGTILDENNNPVNTDTKIAIKINGKTVENTRVSNGTINVTLDTSSYSAGNYNVTVVAGENGRFATSTNETTLTIKS